MGKVNTVDVYLKEKMKTNKLTVNYNKGKLYGIENTKFNFTSKPVKEPYGDVCFTTGYDNNNDYTSTFLMSCEEALELGKMLIDTALEAMDVKRIILEAEGYDAKLSYLVLQDLIDTIRLTRHNTSLKNYSEPYYLYTVTAYSNDEKVLSYNTVYNLSYFTNEKQIDGWKKSLTNNGKVKLYLDWDPYRELEIRKEKAQKETLKYLSENNINLKPIPINK